MKRLMLIGIIFVACNSFAQLPPNRYWISYTDKNDSPFSINRPEEFLSDRAIERRVRYHIKLREQDLPVNPSYIDSIKAMGVDFLYHSKWFNGSCVSFTNPETIEDVANLSFVQSMRSFRKSKSSDGSEKLNLMLAQNSNSEFSNDSTLFDYGAMLTQIAMLKGHLLHNQGFHGQGMLIAILDGGFKEANTNPAFDSLWAGNQVVGTWDFVTQTPVTFDTHIHGSQVLSTIAANIPGVMVGAAPKASFLLLRTEYGPTENIIEEYNWLAGAEYADSAGADLITCSLAYTVYEDPAMDHSYADMDGNTAPVSIAADIASSKGILVVTSAANEGSNPDWGYIGAPGDADSVLTVGAVDRNGDYASFSSKGPTSDGRIKPNVVAMGMGTALSASDGSIIYGNGTSFSTPIVCGLLACLWQSNRSLDNMALISLLQENSSRAANPDTLLGFGIPDFSSAFFMIQGINIDWFEYKASIRAYPNPFRDRISIDFYSPYPSIVHIEIIDLSGRVIHTETRNPGYNNFSQFQIKLDESLNTGLYFIRVSTNQEQIFGKIIKQADL